MSSENPGAPCGVNSNDADINSNLKELLLELHGQKGEINSLKEKIRGNSLSVASEVKKLIAILCNHFTFYIGGSARVVSDFSQTFSVCVLSHKNM